MAFVLPVPSISISPAPEDETPRFEPYSPFARVSFDTDEDDGFRARHLTPPPTTTKFKRPLTPPTRPTVSSGLNSQRFQALLKSTRERAGLAQKDSSDLRKEIAVKAHQNKQAERRALFLSKIHAPPSPTATMTPKTPPESPSVFHYTLPSPGLVSPLALFETLHDKGSIPHTWVEHVDFRKVVDDQQPAPTITIVDFDNADSEPTLMLTPPPLPSPKPRSLPSLDQISARLIPRSGNDIAPSPTRNAGEGGFIGVGRLRMPVRALQAKAMPPALHSPVPRTPARTASPSTRDQTAHAMLSTLKRRTSPTIDRANPDPFEDTFKLRRRSAPANIISRPRIGFEHPVLAHPAGF